MDSWTKYTYVGTYTRTHIHTESRQRKCLEGKHNNDCPQGPYVEVTTFFPGKTKWPLSRGAGGAALFLKNFGFRNPQLTDWRVLRVYTQPLPIRLLTPAL